MSFYIGTENPNQLLWQELLNRIASGEADALAALYDGTSRVLYPVALYILRVAEDAEEIILDVYLQVWRTARTYDSGKGSVLNWLLVITRSRCLDRIRARSPNTVELSAKILTTALAPEGVFDPSYKPGLIAALQSLSAEQQQLVELAFFSGFSHSELAQKLQLPLGTVKTRIRSALTNLRRRL